MKHKVFVYGTLKKGYCNHYILLGKTPQSATAYNIQLHTGVEYPFAIRGQGTVHGEVYEVDDEILRALDQLEQDHDDYYRELTPVLLENRQETQAWIYLSDKAVLYPRIEDGIWTPPE